MTGEQTEEVEFPIFCHNMGETTMKHLYAKRLEEVTLPEILCTNCGQSVMKREKVVVMTKPIIQIIRFGVFNADARTVECVTITDYDLDDLILLALIKHIGNNIDAGHYICFVPTRRGWKEFNDSGTSYKASPPKKGVYIGFYIDKRFVSEEDKQEINLR